MGLSSKQVSSDRHGWNQALLQGSTLELPKPTSLKRQASQVQQQQHTQQQVEQLKCPRCESSNTKFCYYNNYNKSQPRHFCKACKRHWTKGGTLRNVPVGGGRKNKRLKTSISTNTTTKAASKSINTTITTPTTTTTTTTPNSSDNIKMLLHTQQHPRFSLPLGLASASSLNSYDDKNNNNNNNFSEAFYQTLVRQQPSSLVDTSITFNNKSLNDGIFLGDHHLQFPYSNLGNFENNPCSISPSNFYNFTGDNSDININNDNQPSNNVLEEQQVITNNTSLSSSSLSDHHHHQQWKISSSTTANSVIDISSNWGWEDFDKFVTVDADLTMPWDDTEIK